MMASCALGSPGIPQSRTTASMAGFSTPKMSASLRHWRNAKASVPKHFDEHGEYILVIIDHKDVQCHGLLASLPHANSTPRRNVGFAALTAWPENRFLTLYSVGAAVALYRMRRAGC
jgi:hypothetical protein